MTSNSKKGRHSYLMVVAGALLCMIVGLGVGLIIGFLVDPKDPGDNPTPRLDKRAEYREAVKASNIRENLRELTQKPHVAGTEADLETAQAIKSKWLENGIDEAYLVPYRVLLQYPPDDESAANRAQILDNGGNVVFETALKSDPLGEDILTQDGIPAPFCAYSASGDVTGELVYCNYCTLDDLEYLSNTLLPGVNLTGKIFISRFGGTGRSTKVVNAQSYGASALLIYSDPADYSVNASLGLPYPNGPFLPPTAVQRGSIFVGVGDPLTPGYPSTDGAFRLDESDAGLPTIPVHPINYGDAANLLRRLTGPRPPLDWQGNLEGVNYEVGPGFKGVDSGRQVRVVVNSYSEQRLAYNVIGFIHGEIEPDRYVIIGNHRDAWGLGAVDPTSGTACLLEITRVIGDMKKNGWRPRRSIVFGSWGAEEYGLIGSVEWTEEYYHLLGSRSVAYLNLDIAVAGNYIFRPSASPHISPVMIEAMKNVLDPAPSYEGQSIYDSFLNKSDYNKDNLDESFIIPRIGAGSDYYGFVYGVGVSCLSGYFFYDADTYPTSFYSLYHTQYETFRLMEEFIDPGFVSHRAVSQIFGDMLLNLADSQVIPANVIHYSNYLFLYYSRLNVTSYRDKLVDHGLSMTYLERALLEFMRTTDTFQREIVPSVDKNDPLAVRAINDRIMLLERAFLDRNGLPGQPTERHTIFAYPKNQKAPYNTFPGLVDAIENIDENDPDADWSEVEKQLSILSYIIHSASSTLKREGAWTEVMPNGV
ncbi:N-acetylated-alpha-linked acidic dipeptidase 2-like isoform X2 [Apostichopus japonicus]